MEFIFVILGVIASLTVLVLAISYICFRMAFYTDRKNDPKEEEFSIPEGDIYLPYKDKMIDWMKEVRTLPSQEFTITSFDGLKLHGKYYEHKKGAPIELMFHGYRGSGERDLCGGVQRCFKLQRNVLIVDQRASGKSEGNIITFGINESRDCLSWVDFLIEHFGKSARIILTGISMGAATVLMATGKDLPENVIGVLADCGYSSPRDIIKKVIRDMKLPASLLFPFVKLGGIVFGHFNIDETSPLEAVKNCKVPVIFIHGEADAYVPCEMSRQTYSACPSPKVLLTVPEAGHGLAYLVDPEKYFETLIAFCKKNNIN